MQITTRNLRVYYGLFAQVEIVELGLGHRVVDVHSGHAQQVGSGQLIQAMNARHALLDNAAQRVEQLQVVLLSIVGQIAAIVQQLHLTVTRARKQLNCVSMTNRISRSDLRDV